MWIAYFFTFIVWPIKDDSKFKYEVIVGSRRLQACLTANLPIDAILVETFDAEAATIQIKENGSPYP